jgi:DNA-binding SARP family transcriptional activator
VPRAASGAAALVVLTLAFGAWTGTAGALPVGRQFAEVGTVLWPGTAADGSASSSPVTVDVVEVALGAELGDPNQLSADQHYFLVSLHPTYEFAGVLTPVSMPPTTATLTTAAGTVTGRETPPSDLVVDATWYFPVPADLSSAMLHIDGFTKVLGDERGDFPTWTFGPITIDLVATSPVATSPSTSAPVVGQHRQTRHHPADGERSVGAPTGGGIPLGLTLGVGVAALALLAAGGTGLTVLRRRRAFSRADREGRVVLSGPPVLLAGAVLPPGRRAIAVKLLGPLEVEGTQRPVTAGPLLEIIVFLALHPGKTFTSVQLRESIWGLGRRPITSNTFRVYMVALRKAFGPGVVVTDVYRYQLTEVVTSDWSMFRSALQADDELAGREQGLALVRGPVLHGSFDGKKNSPFSWATKKANEIEDQVTSVAMALALACLDLDDPRRAAAAVSQGLLCSEANVRLRKMDLGVGAALGARGKSADAWRRGGRRWPPSSMTSTSWRRWPSGSAGRSPCRIEIERFGGGAIARQIAGEGVNYFPLKK